MSEKIKKIRVKQTDGSMSDYIPLGANAEDIDLKNGLNVEQMSNKKPYYFNSVADMKAAEYLKEGDCAITLGYYEPNDGGGTLYQIRKKINTDIEDNGSIHFLNNNLVAKLLSDKMYPEFFGCKGNGIDDDTVPFLQMINFLYKEIYKYKKIIELLPEKTYLLSQPIPIAHSLQILGKTKSCNSTIKNVTTDMFYVPQENTSYDGSTYKIWSYYFKNVKFEGSLNTNFLKEDNYQHWGTKIIDCTFKTFYKIFEHISVYASHYEDISADDIITFGTISGSDNLIQDMIYTGVKNALKDRELYSFDFYNLYLTRFLNCFLTGSLNAGTGTKNILRMKTCRDITIENNWFDYSDCSAIFIDESNFINVNNNTIRGCSRRPEGNYIANIEIKGSKNVNICSNTYLNVHQGEQNMEAKAYRLWDYQSFISKNILIKDNKFEIPYFYNISLYNKTLTESILIDEKNVNKYLETGINFIQKYSVSKSMDKNIYYYQDNFGNIICTGTSSGTVSIYLNGSYGSTVNLFTAKAGNKYKIEIDNINTDIQLLLTNGSEVVRILNHDEEFIPSKDTIITGIAIYIQSNKTYNYAKIKPKILLVQ